MSTNPASTVYVGNLDERVSERVLYDILIQAGRVVDLYIPKDKETERAKGFAFAEYESEEAAEYAVKLFSGLVTLYNRTLKFAISGKDKPSTNLQNTRPRPLPLNNNVEASPFRSNLYSPVSPPGVLQLHHQNGHRAQHESDNYEYSRRVNGASLDSYNYNSRLSRYDRRDSGHNPY
jgi:splicing factor 3B subunit 4